jgi:TMEM175 potassium channel family protein
MSNANELARIEAFSDGVFAIAATLLVLEIRVPSIGIHSAPGELWRGLADLWPSYVAFVISFGSILTIWVNHHRELDQLTGASNAFKYANGLLLLTVTFLPFPTALLARYIQTDSAPAAVVFFAATGFVTNLAFGVWFLSMQRPVRLLRLGRNQIRRIWQQMVGGALGYLVAAIIGWWLPLAGLGMLVALSVLWIVMSIEQR